MYLKNTTEDVGVSWRSARARPLISRGWGRYTRLHAFLMNKVRSEKTFSLNFLCVADMLIKLCRASTTRFRGGGVRGGRGGVEGELKVVSDVCRLG
ncbi:hypothetical protein K523DRAFT_320895 [Schizophyllum commune Tattone D]|nr:hypothetical protein K523DRAFT_320895 [Schizophyllum commune Tattone D]